MINGTSFSPTVTTTYTVTGTDGNNCTNTSVRTITVNTLPVISIASPTAICSGQSATLTASGANTYSWTTGATSAAITVSPALTTTYSVVGTSTAGCTGSLTRTVTVNALPNVTASSNASLICSGQSATITATGGTTYSWNTGATNSSIVVTPTIQTTYTVQGTDGNGCSKTATVTQNVSACTGIQSLAGSNEIQMNVYPNPTSGQFTIELSNSADLFITNAVGQVIRKEMMSEGKHTVDLSNETNGIYLVRVILDNRQYSLKLLKQ